MQKRTIKKLTQDLEQELLRLGYTKGSLKFYKNCWKSLLKFSKEKNQSYYSEQLGIEFIETHFKILKKDFNGTLKQSEVQNLRVIRMLGDFQLHGAILRRYYKHKKLLHNTYFIEIYNNFKNYCIDKDYANATVEHYSKTAAKFLDYTDSKKITSCKNITLSLINNYIKTLAGYQYKTVEQQLCGLRAFFKYLFTQNLITEDFSTKIPMVQARKQVRIPSVWAPDDLRKLITAIDRGSPMGKRDYAILLLACRLGLRVKDIKELKMQDFHWEEKQLDFIQSKTRTRLKLPIPQDVGWAIIDYLRYGRPKVESTYLFIRHLAPFLPFSSGDHLRQIVVKYMRLAHLPISNNKKVGMHSLRHTLASVLLENDTDLPTISNILGHIDTQSTAVYLKVDIKKLKECAMDIREGNSNE